MGGIEAAEFPGDEGSEVGSACQPQWLQKEEVVGLGV